MQEIKPIYIFVSHSHKDLKKVRVLRNYLESLNGEPILFFLKSLNDVDQITTLIKNEIDARIWFIYCKSKNAEESTWVKSELEYVTTSKKQNQLVIDLENDFDENGDLLESTKERIDSAFKIFKFLSNIIVSFTSSDQKEFNYLKAALSKYGVKVNSFLDFQAGCNWLDIMKDNIEECSAYVAFLSNASIQSEFFLREIKTAIANGKNIVPILLDKEAYDTSLTIVKNISNLMYIYFDRNNPEQSAVEVIQKLFSYYLQGNLI